MHNEQEHIEKLTKGSYKDFTILYQSYAPQLYAYVFSLIKSHSQTKDIVQETFIKLWEKREQTNQNLSFKSYLFAIARNHVLNEFRKQVNNPAFSDYMNLCSEDTPSENMVQEQIDFDEFCRLIEQAKKKLSPRQLEIFELNKEQGYSIKEIAENLHIKEQVVRNQLSTALQILRSEIGKYTVWLAIWLLS